MCCTDLRAVETIETLERRLKKPVVTSNQAMMYAALKRLGIEIGETAAGGQLLARVAHGA